MSSLFSVLFCLTTVLTLRGSSGGKRDLVVAVAIGFKKMPSKQQQKTLTSFYLKPKVYKLIYRNIPKEETKSEKSLLMNGSL